MALKYKRYQRGLPHTYALGTFPAREALERRPDLVEAVFLSSDASESASASVLRQLCEASHVPCLVDDRQIASLSPKENCHALAMIRIGEGQPLLPDTRHVVLFQPSNAGNVGTILRAALGFGILDVAVITPAVDLWHPSVLRSAMGAAFSVRQECFGSFEEYVSRHQRPCHAFALADRASILGQFPFEPLCSLVFGPEASGLPVSVVERCHAVRIAHSSAIDSLNLSVAASLALYELTRGEMA